MQKILLVGLAVAGLLSGPALASDLPLYNAPIAAPPYNWSGFYVGPTLAGIVQRQPEHSGNNLYGGFSEFVGGVQGGLQLPGRSLSLWCRR